MPDRQSNPWTAREDAILKRYYPTVSWERLLKMFNGRTRVAIRFRASNGLGLQRNTGMRRRYSPKEERILQKLFSYASKEEVLRALPGRNWCSINNYARASLGLSRPHPHSSWTDEEFTILKKFYQIEPMEKIVARFPGRTESGICHQARALGLFLLYKRKKPMASNADINEDKKWLKAMLGQS